MSPAISVIVPLYNAENFIRQCLISVLASKFENYEVLLIDDCSTDNGVEVAEKLLPHFSGRFKIFRTEKNSGGAGVPRNLGIKNSSGKYITFIDNDDMILPTALENFFAVAEETGADVVHTEKCLGFRDVDGQNFSRNDLQNVFTDKNISGAESNLTETPDLNDRLNRYFMNQFGWLPWGKFFRRDFLTDNKIEFPQLALSEDMIFCFKCLCLAKKYVRVPFAANIHRFRIGSSSQHVSRTLSESLQRWLSVILPGSEILDDFMNGEKFFELNTERREDVLKFWVHSHLDFMRKNFSGMSKHEIKKFFKTELKKFEPDKNSRRRKIFYKYFPEYEFKFD